uniref:Uncharacterized protein n=1 Tax=Anser brachyrhynchus TaxID=132585 RepID=A0A8B9BNE2_9AVES
LEMPARPRANPAVAPHFYGVRRHLWVLSAPSLGIWAPNNPLGRCRRAVGWEVTCDQPGTEPVPGGLQHPNARSLKPPLPRERAGSAPSPRGTGTAPEDRCLSPPCSKMPAISRGLMKGARSSIPATSCRGKRLGCLRHRHPAPTICSASILKSAGARRSASPSLPTAEGGGGFLRSQEAATAPRAILAAAPRGAGDILERASGEVLVFPAACRGRVGRAAAPRQGRLGTVP